ncbi:MAG: cell envelope integrity protein TolA [Pseudomonadota bacterium]
MMVQLSRSTLAARPVMLFLSAGVHAAIALLLTLASIGTLNDVKPPEKREVTRVKLLDQPVGIPHVRKVEAEEGGPDLGRIQEPLDSHERPEDPPAVETTEILEARSLSRPVKSTVKLRKRKGREPLVVEGPKPREKKAAEDGDKAPKDPKAALNDRLAELRDQVSKKKAKASDANAAGASGKTGTSAAAGALGNGSGHVDEEMMKWFAQVRSSINEHWSVFGENVAKDRTTLIGINLAADGGLLDAAVDKTSGDPVFDRSAMRAIYQAAPFPPVPEQVLARIKVAGGLALRFTPKGLQ